MAAFKSLLRLDKQDFIFFQSSGSGDEKRQRQRIYKGNDFTKMIQSGTPFVDKSLLIKELMEDPTKTILVARPRGFGKSTNLSMLKNFLNLNGSSVDLFQNLSIARDIDFCKRHQNKHPVIHLSFRGMAGKTFDECKRQLTVLVNSIFLEHMYLQKSDRLTESEKKDYTATYTGSAGDTPLALMIPKLLRFMNQHYRRKIVVLLEHYDSPIASAHSHQFPNEMFNFIREIMHGIFHDADLGKGIIFGIFTAGENLFEDVKNIKSYTVCHEKYAGYFGFLESEIKGLMERYINFKNHGINHQETMKKIKDYYEGYTMGSKIIYSPWSIINCLINGGKIDNYWMNDMGGEALLGRMLADGVMTPQVVDMFLRGVEMGFGPDVLTRTKLCDEDLYWAYLVQMGFLTVKSTKDGKACCELKIPNKEIGSTVLKTIHDMEKKNETAAWTTSRSAV